MNRPGICVRDLPHEFDPVSGWCMHGCGWRDDGRSQYTNPRARTVGSVPDITEPRRPRDEESTLPHTRHTEDIR